MKLFTRYILASIMLLTVLFIAACGGDDSPETVSIAPFLIVDDTTIRLNGVINSNTLDAFNEVIRQNPDTELLIFGNAPGSDNDDVNLQVGRRLYQLGLNTHVENNGEIASGAVDLFLAGRQRTLGSSVLVGVHSWADGDTEATDLPRNAPEHRLYIQYYQAVGFTSQWAEDFYFFTINAASADDIHWMTPAEIETYGITTD